MTVGKLAGWATFLSPWCAWHCLGRRYAARVRALHPDALRAFHIRVQDWAVVRKTLSARNAVPFTDQEMLKSCLHAATVYDTAGDHQRFK